jgi:GTPase SAR1 family protein
VNPVTGDRVKLIRFSPVFLRRAHSLAAAPPHWFSWFPHFFTQQIPHFFVHLVPDWFSWFPHFFTQQIPHFFVHLVPDWFSWFPHFFTRQIPHFFVHLVPDWFSWFPHFFTRQIPHFFVHLVPDWYGWLRHSGVPTWALAVAAAAVLVAVASSAAWLLRARIRGRRRARAWYAPTPSSNSLRARRAAPSGLGHPLRRPAVLARRRPNRRPLASRPLSTRHPVPQRPALWRRTISVLGVGAVGREQRIRRRSTVAAAAGQQLDWAERAASTLGLQDSEIDRLVAAIRAKLADRTVRVAVVGEFSSGKSTLVNAICRAELLPSAALATTSVVTMLVNGNQSAAVSVVNGGPTCTLPKDASVLSRHLGGTPLPSDLVGQLKLLTADKDISAHVASLTVRWNAPFLARGVVLLDTPGLNSAHHRHTQLAKKAVAEADLLLMLIPVDQSITESLRDVIAEHLQLRPRSAAFCLTMIDRISQDEVDAVVESTTIALREVTGLADPSVLTVAALPALRAVLRGRRDDPAARAFEEFEAGITALARQGRDAILGEVAARQAGNLLERLDAAITAHTKQLRQAADALKGSPVADLTACLDRWVNATQDSTHKASAAAMPIAESEASALERSLHDDLAEILQGPPKMDGTIANLDSVVPRVLADFQARIEAAHVWRHDQPVTAAFLQATKEMPGLLQQEVVNGSRFTGPLPPLPAASAPRRIGLIARAADLEEIRRDALSARKSLPGFFRRVFRGGGREAVTAAQRQVYRAVVSHARSLTEEIRDATSEFETATSRAADTYAAACRQAWWPTISGLEQQRRAREQALLAEASSGEQLRSGIRGRRRDLDQAVRESARKVARS